MQWIQTNSLLRRTALGAAVTTMLGIAACADMKPETMEKWGAFAGTVFELATVNYSGPHQAVAESLVTMFNGSEVEDNQVGFDQNDPYGMYVDDSYAYDESQTDYGAGDYQEAAYYPEGTPSIDAGLIGMDSYGELELLDSGATLRGPSNGRPSDRVGVAFMPANDAYVYIVAFDGTGWTQALYPDPVMGHQNPVPAGTEVLIPGDQLYSLDGVTGVETIYVMASNYARPDVEADLAPFFGKERPPGAQPTYRSVKQPIIISRGLAGLRPASVNATQVSPSNVAPSGTPVLNSFLAADGATEMTVTLWFNHE